MESQTQGLAQEIFVCDWCGQSCTHEGKAETPYGILQGNFCDETHFSLWLKWKISFLKKLNNKEGADA